MVKAARLLHRPFDAFAESIIKRRFLRAASSADYLRAYLNASLLAARRRHPESRGLQQAAALLLAVNPRDVTHNVALLFRHKASEYLKEYILAVLRLYGTAQAVPCALAIQSLAKRKALSNALILQHELAEAIVTDRAIFPSYLQASALIYLERYESAHKFLTTHKPSSSLEALYFIQAEALCELALGSPPREVFSSLYAKELKSSLLSKSRRTSIDAEKRTSIFADKAIAIVGPAIDLSDILKCINDFDCLIVPNAMQASRFGNFKGTRLSYYNLPFYTRYADQIAAFCAAHTVIPVVNTPAKRAALLRSLPAHIPVFSRTTSFCPFLTTRDGLHAIQRIAWDVLKFSPSHVAVFGTSFFMSPYTNTYVDTSVFTYIDAGNVGLCHGPLQSLLFTKVLVDSKTITVDDMTNTYVQTSRHEYLAFLANLNKAGAAQG
jgi:hypothetical protein